MPSLRTVLLLVCLLVGGASARAAVPEWLPRYDLDIQCELDKHVVHVHEKVTWTNRHKLPTDKLVFNAHAHYKIPDGQVGLLAKTVEILRAYPSDSMDFEGDLLQIEHVTLDGAELAFAYAANNLTALEVALPHAVGPGESVTVDVSFSFRLPQKQGRWGQWQGVTTLSAWLPVLAYFDETGWQPTPFVPWHQPFFNEAGVYSARIRLPCDQRVVCSGTVTSTTEIGDGMKQLEIHANGVRDFALLCSARYVERTGEAGPTKVRVMALPEHSFYAQKILQYASEALTAYSHWFGPYPYPEFTVVESFFPWNGNENACVVMIDDRVFGMPHLASGYVEYLLYHEICHQWWYNLIGTNGYSETFMDEGPATYFSHRLLNMRHGKNNPFIRLPAGFGWAPNIYRDTYRNYSLYGAIGRGDDGPILRELPQYGHVVNLFSMNYDKGSKVMGLIEERLGEAAFLDFIHLLFAKYQYRILRVTDLRRELEEYQGQSWEEFFQFWLYGPGMTDWAVDKVKVQPVGKGVRLPAWSESFLTSLAKNGGREKPSKVTVTLRQKADCSEPTVVGFDLDGSDTYAVRVPIHPGIDFLTFEEHQATVQLLPDKRIRVEIILPCPPSQVAVDPDQVLIDREPANNYWKPKIRLRLTPIYTQLEETDITNAYDSWNVIAGPWMYGPAYNDPWFTRSAMAGLRVGAYRTQQFAGGVYLGYRTDYADMAAGVDLFKDHWPWPRTQVGLTAERSITQYNPNEATADRGVVYGRYIFQYGSSLYMPPMEYVELFGAVQNHYLPWSATTVPGAQRADHETAVGIHYRKDYLTPYWDAEGGFRLDLTYTNGVPIFGEDKAFNQGVGRLSATKSMPDGFGYFSETRLAAQVYGAAGLPDQRQFFSLGGSNLIRGFNLGQRQGSIVWVSSLEWRLPIIKHVTWDVCDHMAGVRGVYGALFYDVGNAYLNGQELGKTAHSVGAGVRWDVAWFSFIERTILRVDAAKVLNAATPLQFWFGVQQPF